MYLFRRVMDTLCLCVWACMHNIWRYRKNIGCCCLKQKQSQFGQLYHFVLSLWPKELSLAYFYPKNKSNKSEIQRTVAVTEWKENIFQLNNKLISISHQVSLKRDSQENKSKGKPNMTIKSFNHFWFNYFPIQL